MLAGKRIAILVEEGFEDSELMVPLQVLKDAGARVVIVGSGASRNYKGRRGAVIDTAGITADHVQANDFDIVIIPGGQAPDKIRLCQPMIDLIREAHRKGKVIAAISYGTQVLISADMVRGVRLTSSPSIAVDLRNAGAVWLDEPVVKDGNIITSRRAADLPKLNKAIVAALMGLDTSSKLV
jgi:protease I